MRIKLPEFFTLHDDDDQPFRVRFDFDEGEEQWFDARAGVGSPGYPPSVEITAIDRGMGWAPVEAYPLLNLDSIEQQVMDRINAIYESEWEKRSEYERSQIETAKSLEQWGGQ